SGRNLAAQDRLMFNTVYEAEMMNMIYRNYRDKGLRGKALRKAAIDDYTNRNVDMEELTKKLDDEILNYEKISGKRVGNRQRKIRLNEMLIEISGLTSEQKTELS